MLIDIDLNILDSVARAASDIADDVSGTSRSVNSASENVNAAWRSDTSQIYVREIEGVAVNLESISRELRQLSNVVRNYAARMRQLERENSALFGGRSGGGGGGGGGHSF